MKKLLSEINKKELKKLTPNKLIFVLGIMGALLSMYMWSFHISDKVIPCTLTDCEHVLTSEYSEMFGVPVAAFGFAYYAAIMVISFQRAFIKHKLLNKMLLSLISWGVLFSVYLRYLEFVKLDAICQWCWLSVFIIILMVLTYFVEKRSRR